MGRWRAVVPIFLAFIIAGVGSYYVHQWLQRQSTPVTVIEPGEKIETVPVLVAAADIEWGTELTSEMFKKQAYPASSVPKGHFSDPEVLEGRVARLPITADVPILEPLLAPESVETGGITAVIKEGFRAIAVAGNKVLGLSGLIGPGNRVDVLLTTTDPESGETITKTILEDLLVLAAGPQLTKGTTVFGEGKPSPVDVYTLEVTPEQAEKITLAASKGKLGFALRSYADKDIVLTRGEKLEGLLAAYRQETIVISDLSPEIEVKEVPPEPVSGIAEEEAEMAAAEPKPLDATAEDPSAHTVEEVGKPEPTGPEIQVEIINGTDREVKKYKL
jgi:pilus assembly protein CpaB